MIEAKLDLVLIDCTKAIDNGVRKKVILQTAEEYFNASYWQPYYSWDTEFKFLMVNSSGMVGKRYITDTDNRLFNVVVIPWSSISGPGLEGTIDKTDFNEELL